VESIKVFFKTLAKESKGYIGPKISLQTLEGYLGLFVTVQRREHGRAIPKSVKTEVQEVPMIINYPKSLPARLIRL
jgi:hypothetical protein